jgi:hypothetical protein
MTGKRKTPIVPTYKGKPVQALMSVEKGEEIAGTWTTPVVSEIGFYKLLAKRRTDGVCEWVHFTQRADGSKDKVYRGTVESKEQLADVVAAINSALHTAYGPLVQLHPAEAEVSFVDGVPTGMPPGRAQ